MHESVQVFIMGAGKGSRLSHNLGKMIPKCLLPTELLVNNSGEGGLILGKIVESLKEGARLGDCELKIDLMVSHKGQWVKDYIRDNFQDVELHQIDWSPSSVSTFKKCIELVNNRHKFDKYVFINGDTYISSIESMKYTFHNLFESPENAAVIEFFEKPVKVWSNVYLSRDFVLTHIFPYYNDTCKTLCDVTEFSFTDLMSLHQQVCNSNFNHEWWEMSFIDRINNGSLIMHGVPVRKLSQERVLYNTNGIREMSSDEILKVLGKFNLDKVEEERFDVKEI